MKRTLPILLVLLCIAHAGSFAKDLVVPCGSYVELHAIANEDYHFVEWSDGNTDSLRVVQVLGEELYIAYFEAACGAYANWPIVSRFGTTIMLDIKTIRAKGYYFSDNDVTWYRVVGEVDDVQNTGIVDDEKVGTGYYISVDNNLVTTGSYYAIVDISSTAAGQLCSDFMRSRIVQFVAKEPPLRQLQLIPNYVLPGQQIRLIGLKPDEETVIRVYSAAGQLVQELTSTGVEETLLTALISAGCYLVQVTTPEGQYTLKYIVKL